MSKKIVSFVLSIVMVLAMLPMTALADEVAGSKIHGKDVQWKKVTDYNWSDDDLASISTEKVTMTTKEAKKGNESNVFEPSDGRIVNVWVVNDGKSNSKVGKEHKVGDAAASADGVVADLVDFRWGSDITALKNDDLKNNDLVIVDVEKSDTSHEYYITLVEVAADTNVDLDLENSSVQGKAVTEKNTVKVDNSSAWQGKTNYPTESLKLTWLEANNKDLVTEFVTKDSDLTKVTGVKIAAKTAVNAGSDSDNVASAYGSADVIEKGKALTSSALTSAQSAGADLALIIETEAESGVKVYFVCALTVEKKLKTDAIVKKAKATNAKHVAGKEIDIEEEGGTKEAPTEIELVLPYAAKSEKDSSKDLSNVSVELTLETSAENTCAWTTVAKNSAVPSEYDTPVAVSTDKITIGGLDFSKEDLYVKVTSQDGVKTVYYKVTATMEDGHFDKTIHGGIVYGDSTSDTTKAATSGSVVGGETAGTYSNPTELNVEIPWDTSNDSIEKYTTKGLITLVVDEKATVKTIQTKEKIAGLREADFTDAKAADKDGDPKSGEQTFKVNDGSDNDLSFADGNIFYILVTPEWGEPSVYVLTATVAKAGTDAKIVDIAPVQLSGEAIEASATNLEGTPSGHLNMPTKVVVNLPQGTYSDGLTATVTASDKYAKLNGFGSDATFTDGNKWYTVDSVGTLKMRTVYLDKPVYVKVTSQDTRITSYYEITFKAEQTVTPPEPGVPGDKDVEDGVDVTVDKENKSGKVVAKETPVTVDDILGAIENIDPESVQVLKDGQPVTDGKIGTNYQIVADGYTFDVVVKGDVNSDGLVNVLDMVAIGKNVEMDALETEAADVNGDGKINVLDMVKIGLNS